MNILIIGYFTDHTKLKIQQSFPEAWEVNIVEPEKEEEYLKDCEVLIPEHIKVDENLLTKAPNLKFVQTGAGYDNVDVKACTKKGVWVSNAAGINAQAVAEHVMAMMFAYYKNIVLLSSAMIDGQDERLIEYQGAELCGKTIGILGLGAIGKKVAHMCNAVGMKVLAYDIEKKDCEDYIEQVDLEYLVQNSDVITIHIFLNDKTKYLVNKDFLAKMKKSSIIINTARGKIVKEDDLIKAIKANQIGGACLDVFEEEPLPLKSELRKLKNVILTPHTAGMPDAMKYHKARYQFFKENCEKILKKETPNSNLNNL